MHPHRPSWLASILLTLALSFLAPTGVRAGEEEPTTPPASEEQPAVQPTVQPADAPGGKRRPMLWVLEGESPVYLFGTIHVPDPRVLDLPEVVEKAFEAAEVFYAELELDPGSMAAAQRHMLLPADQSLDTILGEETWARLVPLMAESGVPEMALKRLKTWVASMQLMMRALTPAEDPDEAGAEDGESEPEAPREAMDAVLYRNAVAAGKTTGGLETIEEQIAIFDSLSNDAQVSMLKEMLLALEQKQDESTEGEEEKALESVWESMVRLYIEGDADGLGTLIRELAEKEGETMKSFMVKLFDVRNVRMAERILERRTAAAGRTLFVAVGSGHYPGEKGILALLEAKGETVRRVEMDDVVPVPQPAVPSGR